MEGRIPQYTMGGREMKEITTSLGYRIHCLDCGWNIPDAWNRPEQCPGCGSDHIGRVETIRVTRPLNPNSLAEKISRL